MGPMPSDLDGSETVAFKWKSKEFAYILPRAIVQSNRQPAGRATN